MLVYQGQQQKFSFCAYAGWDLCLEKKKKSSSITALFRTPKTGTFISYSGNKRSKPFYAGLLPLIGEREIIDACIEIGLYIFCA